jgi:hypothetical protein
MVKGLCTGKLGRGEIRGVEYVVSSVVMCYHTMKSARAV